MKHAKRLVSLLLTMVMLLAMGVTSAFAAGSDGSITITNATVGKKYSVYKVFDLTYSTNDDSTTNVAYTYTKNGESDTFLAALQGESSPFNLTETTTSGVYSVTLTAGKTASDVSTFLTKQQNNLTAAATATAEGSELTFNNLAYGYYFVTSEVGTVLTIDSTIPNAQIVDKNQKPDWDNEDPENPDEDYPDKPGKVIIENGVKKTENTANFGDTVNFSIAVNATAYVGDQQATYYYITDTLADGFSAASNIKVKVGGVEKTLGTDYKLDQNGNTFTVTVPYAEAYGANARIEVTYSATVENDAVLAGSGNLNTANFTYDTKEPGTDTPNPDTDPNFPEDNKKTTTTYVYALGIVKVDPEGNTLEGAEFSVQDNLGNDIWATGDNGIYEYCKAGTEGAVKQFATDDNGVLVIKGVKDGSYKVTEQVAPKGYNLLQASTTVEATLKGEYTTTITTYLDTDGKVTEEETQSTKTYEAAANVAGLVIVNNKGTELPATGGIGTTLFYALGGVLVVGAAVLLVVKKRMGRDAQ